jgi:hypothetical protein
VLPLYTATLFVSAYLLFLVQPMVGKMILPALGGTPAVWNTCMVFFQAVLLAGYAYAHGSVRLLGVRGQAWLQLVLLLLPLALSVLAIAAILPIAIDTSSVPTSENNPVWWLLGRLLLGVGLPFFVVSSNAPVLQMWFSRTGHASAKDPYFLYGASNLGSMLALLGYPVLVEPVLVLGDQSWAWAGGYALLFVLASGCAVGMWRASRKAADRAAAEAADGAAAVSTSPASEVLTVGRRLRWVALAFVPSSLMLGVTTHITAEIAPVPLLWVVPLALYLFTFVLVFARQPLIPLDLVLKVFPFLVAPTLVMTVQGIQSGGALPIPVHLAAFFVTAMACHGIMAKDRPSTRHLTQFYLLMSIGGVLGGLFNAIVGPLAFDTLVEYPLVMVLACFLAVPLGRRQGRLMPRLLDFGLPVLAGTLAIVLLTALWSIKVEGGGRLWEAKGARFLSVAVTAGLCLVLVKRPLRFALGCGAVVLASVLWFRVYSEDVLYRSRNFYGVKSVKTDDEGHFRQFVHGSTVHGIQEMHPQTCHIPRAYFHPNGPIGDVFRAFNGRLTQRQAGPRLPRSRGARVAILGLGVGSMASSLYAFPDQQFVFYEIDPEVERVARDADLFTFLADCPASCKVVLGDARLTLADAPEAHYQMIILDVFSSDAVPTHLLTREALQIYLSKLDLGGMLVLHVSNRYLDFGPLLGNLAKDAGLLCLARRDDVVTEQAKKDGCYPSEYVVMAREKRDVERLVWNPDWSEVSTRPGLGVWTDQYTNIFRLLSWR